MESITPRNNKSCFSFIHNTCHKHEGLDCRMATHYNAKSSCNMGKERTSALTSPCRATLLDISVGFVDFGLSECPPLVTIATSNGLHGCVFGSCVPCDSSVLRWSVLRGGFVDWATNGSATIAKKSIDDCHHSSPQQTAHLPLLCRGLHLFLSSP